MSKIKELLLILVRSLDKRRRVEEHEIKKFTQSKDRENARCVWDLENEG